MSAKKNANKTAPTKATEKATAKATAKAAATAVTRPAVTRTPCGDGRGTARCAACIFGRAVTLTDTDRKGRVTAKREMCECHVARPTRFGFPVVRLDDFCALHVDADTGTRTFAGLVAE